MAERGGNTPVNRIVRCVGSIPTTLITGALRPFLCVFQENVSSIEAKHAAKYNVLPSRSFHTCV